MGLVRFGLRGDRRYLLALRRMSGSARLRSILLISNDILGRPDPLSRIMI